MLEQRALGNILARHGVVSPDVLEPFYVQQREKGAGLVERAYLFDPWARRIRYEADAAGYRLSVAEEDGHPGAIVDRRGGR